MRILCIGRLILDVVVSPLSRLPLRYEPFQAGDVHLAPGGAAFYVSQLLARHQHQVDILSATGDDFEGNILRSVLQKHGLNRDLIVRKADIPTSKSLVALDRDGNARYVLFRGADCHLTHDDFDRVRKREYDLVYVGNVNQLINDHGEPLASFLAHVDSQTKRPKIVIDLDKELEISDRLWKVSEYADYLTGNAKELFNATQQPTEQTACDAAFARGVRRGVVVKRGERGCFVSEKADEAATPSTGWHHAYFIGPPENENGAGDVFCAELAHRLLCGESLDDAARWANGLASLHVAKRFTITDPEEIDDEMIRNALDNALRVQVDPQTNAEVRKLAEFNSQLAYRISRNNLDWWLNRIVDWTNPNDEQCTFVDFGCGVGRFAGALKEQMPEWRVVGVDRDSDSIAEARGHYPQVEWVESDIGTLDRVDTWNPLFGVVDTVWLSSVLCHPNNDFEQLFEVIHRTLRPGGKLLVRTASHHIVTNEKWYQVFDEGKRYLDDRYMRLSNLISFLVNAKLEPIRIEKRVDVETLGDKEGLKEMFRHKAFAWQSYYGEREDVFNRRLDDVIEHYEGPPYSFSNTTFLVIAEKQSKH